MSTPVMKVAPAKSYNAIVIGGGAGLSAANAAVAQGVKVVLFEKMGVLGGNTIQATGGMNAAGTPQQANVLWMNWQPVISFSPKFWLKTKKTRIWCSI